HNISKLSPAEGSTTGRAIVVGPYRRTRELRTEGSSPDGAKRNPGSPFLGLRGVYHRAGQRPDPVAPSGVHAAQAGGGRAGAARLDEAVGLALAIDLEVVDKGLVAVAAIRPSTYLGKGKVEELAGLVKSHEAGLVVMDCALSPVQQRNLEKAWNAKVVD